MSGPRPRSPFRPLLAGTILTLVALVGCQMLPQTTAPTPTSDVPVATDSPTSTDAASAGPELTATDQSASDTTPEVPPTPPSQALDPSAAALETKLSAFRAALKNQDVNSSLRLQRELLTAANDAES